MPDYFKLQKIDAKSKSSNHAEMVMIERDECYECAMPTVASITFKEFKESDLYELAPKFSPLKLMNLDNNFAEDYPDYIVGSFSIPSKETHPDEPSDFAFIWIRTSLCLSMIAGFPRNCSRA